jgi:hypothetical protein
MSANETKAELDDNSRRFIVTIKLKAGIAHRMRFLTKAEHDEIVKATTTTPPLPPLVVSVTFKMDYAEWAECAKLAVSDPKAWSEKYYKHK